MGPKTYGNFASNKGTEISGVNIGLLGQPDSYLEKTSSGTHFTVYFSANSKWVKDANMN